MPRKKTEPLKPNEVIVLPFCNSEINNTRETIMRIGFSVSGSYSSLDRLPASKRDEFAYGVTHAILKPIDRRFFQPGKGTKPEAWVLDHRIANIYAMWWRAGLQPTIRHDATGSSEFLSFCEDVMRTLGLIGARDSLFHNALRAKTIYFSWHRAPLVKDENDQLKWDGTFSVRDAPKGEAYLGSVVTTETHNGTCQTHQSETAP